MATIKAAVCGASGHTICSMMTKEVQIPGTQTWARQYEILCTQCGTSLEDIRKERIPSTTPRVRKPKAAPVVAPTPVEAA